ncbi:zinc-metallopeptidase, peroxisomal protein [Arabidopsis thaliana]|uniref:Zinc-metallopeptidase, peroxisomal protein n=1 Tax=Arabidopsis thaliana TaxID=3702 RepID=A0A1I9LR11_ARATH|nr:zinc-metallopeptidase, peroxisomal protein [Arabidopsis thaliana]ANM65019.1 zinc-metallopeptidase, peroxisomal protein [Arabidopsis thaliana]|eukprot:NP_001327018.1 zinc-metallopeptidase, peroxisomal protein [Arabidopsis thaliana]
MYLLCVSSYYAQVAGLHYRLSLSDNGFELSLVGFSQKLRIEKLDALSFLKAEDLANFVPMLLSRTFVECYIAGVNIIPVVDIYTNTTFIYQNDILYLNLY